MFLDIDDVEDLKISDNVSKDCTKSKTNDKLKNGVEDHSVTVTASEYEALLKKLHQSEEKARQVEENLQRALEDMENMR